MCRKKPILIILHRSCSDTGKIGTLLEKRGYKLDIRCILEGDDLPEPSFYSAVVIFGGVMSANDYNSIIGIKDEIEWIPSVIKAQVPYLGICLGAQLLAKSLGAGVSRKLDLSVEIGFHQVRPTNKNHIMLPKGGLRFYQWHLEGFSIPSNCERLAESDSFRNQAFMLNPKTIGLQFHPEATREMIDCWVQREYNDLQLEGAQSYKTQVELYRSSDEVVTKWLEKFIDNWLQA